MSHDVADDHRRAQLAKLLESRGRRVQWSVFELLERAVVASRFDPRQDSLPDGVGVAAFAPWRVRRRGPRKANRSLHFWNSAP